MTEAAPRICGATMVNRTAKALHRGEHVCVREAVRRQHPGWHRCRCDYQWGDL